MPQKNTVSFLYGMVTAEVTSARTYAGDAKIAEMEAAIADIIGKKDEGYAWALATCIQYTESLAFNWLDCVPDGFRALETFWAMVKRGAPIAEWWDYYAKNVDNTVLLGVRPETETQLVTLDELTERGLVLDSSPSGLNKVLVRKLITPEVIGWHGAVEQGMKVWTPPTNWKLLSELTPDQRADPLS